MFWRGRMGRWVGPQIFNNASSARGRGPSRPFTGRPLLGRRQTGRSATTGETVVSPIDDSCVSG